MPADRRTGPRRYDGDAQQASHTSTGQRNPPCAFMVFLDGRLVPFAGDAFGDFDPFVADDEPPDVARATAIRTRKRMSEPAVMETTAFSWKKAMTSIV